MNVSISEMPRAYSTAILEALSNIRANGSCSRIEWFDKLRAEFIRLTANERKDVLSGAFKAIVDRGIMLQIAADIYIYDIAAHKYQREYELRYPDSSTSEIIIAYVLHQHGLRYASRQLIGAHRMDFCVDILGRRYNIECRDTCDTADAEICNMNGIRYIVIPPVGSGQFTTATACINHLITVRRKERDDIDHIEAIECEREMTMVYDVLERNRMERARRLREAVRKFDEIELIEDADHSRKIYYIHEALKKRRTKRIQHLTEKLQDLGTIEQQEIERYMNEGPDKLTQKAKCVIM